MGAIRPLFRSLGLGILTCLVGTKLDILERGAMGHSGRTRGSYQTLQRVSVSALSPASVGADAGVLAFSSSAGLAEVNLSHVGLWVETSWG